MIGQLYGVFDDAGKFLQLIHSSIFFSSIPSAAAHSSEARRIVTKFANGAGDCDGIVRIGDKSAAGFANDSGGVTFDGGDDQYGAPGGECAIEFAWDDDAFEAALHSYDVQVACGHYMRNFGG